MYHHTKISLDLDDQEGEQYCFSQIVKSLGSGSSGLGDIINRTESYRCPCVFVKVRGRPTEAAVWHRFCVMAVVEVKSRVVQVLSVLMNAFVAENCCQDIWHFKHSRKSGGFPYVNLRRKTCLFPECPMTKIGPLLSVFSDDWRRESFQAW